MQLIGYEKMKIINLFLIELEFSYYEAYYEAFFGSENFFMRNTENDFF